MSGTDEIIRDAHRLDAQLLSDLWFFRSAALLGSITAAARKMSITQGAVSQRILRLEARLGTPLFVRHKNRMSLTDAGETLSLAMGEVGQVLNDSLSRISRPHKRAIVISCVPSLATEWLVPHLDDFYRQYPGIEIFVRSELAPSTAERMDDERLDLVIDYQPSSAVDLQELASIQEYVFPVCSRAYRYKLDDAAGEALPITLLHDDIPWVGGSANSEWSALPVTEFQNWFGRVTAARHFNLAHLAYHAAMFDQGVAVGRSVIVNRLLSRGELIAAVEGEASEGSFYRVSTNRPGDARSPVRLFAAWWAAAMAETQAQTLALLAAQRYGSG